MPDMLRNWAGNLEFRSSKLHRPTSISELQRIVRRDVRLKAMGTRHSFSDIADTSGEQISTEALPGSIEVDARLRRVKVPAGITYGRLSPVLFEAGFAVPNLASLPHISVVGACATATHGSGNENPNLATSVVEIEYVVADGSVVKFNRDHHADFSGAVVALGGLGIATRITLDVVPSFTVAQEVYEALPFEELEDRFDDITGSAYSVSFFTDWLGPTVSQAWFKRRMIGEAPTDSSPTISGAVKATKKLHPIGHMSPVNCTDQLGLPGPSYERLPHFRMDFVPSAGDELQSEYLVPRKHAVGALRAVRQIAGRFAHILQTSEVRTIAADNLWMSPCYGQPCVGIHFTWKFDGPAVSKAMDLIEPTLEEFDARPHWGKLFNVKPERFERLYERLPAFRRLLQAHDPAGKFRNAFLERYIFG